MAFSIMDLGSHMQMRNHVMNTGALTCTHMQTFPDRQALPVNNKMAEHYTIVNTLAFGCHGYSYLLLS